MCLKMRNFDYSVFNFRTWSKMALILVSFWCLEGCDENSSNTNPGSDTRPIVQCNEAKDCSGQTDGRTICDEEFKQCVFPTVHCEADKDCANLKDGRKHCDEEYKQCLFPPSNPGMDD